MCDGVVLYIDNEWICGQCGVPIDVGGICTECGGKTMVKRRPVTLDTSPDIAPVAVERAIHDRVNAVRRDRGVGELSFDHQLAGVALGHSRHMATADFFAHETPGGVSVADRYDRAGYDRRPCGENLSRVHPHSISEATEIATEIVDGWLHSPDHRRSLLEDAWTVEGIGVYYRSNGSVYATQNFA